MPWRNIRAKRKGSSEGDTQWGERERQREREREREKAHRCEIQEELK
jgi:hypothetical protein